MSHGGEVCAVIYGDCRGLRLEELVQDVSEQSARPAVILLSAEALALANVTVQSPLSVAAFASGEEGQFAAGIRAAAATGTRWTWLLDGQTVPAPEALRALLSGVEALAAPVPLLMASKVLDEEGRLHPDATPRHEIFEKERSVDATERHLVQLRTAAHGSVLVSATAVERFGAPRSDLPSGLDMHEWSARMLRRWEDTGYIVPASVAVRRARPVAHPWRYWLGRVRMLGSPAWTPTEKLWEAFLLGEAVAGAIREPGVRDAPAWGRRTSAHRAAPGE